jgi:two-component system, cell cycle response regulator
MTRVVTTRRTEPPATPQPLAEYALLAGTFVAVAAGFASLERAELGAVRAGALCVIPAALALRSWRSPSLAARRGKRSPLWVPSILALAAVLVQATAGVGGTLAVVALGAAGASSLGAGGRRATVWAGLTLLALLIPGWLGFTLAAPWGTQLAFAVALLGAAFVPGQVLTSERSAHDRTRARLRTLEDETGALREESGRAGPGMRGDVYGAHERDRDLRTIARELQQDMDRACQVLVSGTRARAAAVYRPDGDEDWHRLVVVAQFGDTASLVSEVGAREGVFGAAFKAGAPVCLSSVRPSDPRVVHRAPGDNTGSVLALPLTDGERRWGVVVLDSTEPDTFEGSARHLAAHVADFVSRLITRAVDLSAVREDMRENHAFYEACREVSRHVRIEEIARAVVNSVGEFVHVDACAFALCDASGETLRVIDAGGFDDEPPREPFYVTATEGLLAQSVRHRTVIGRNDLADCSRLPVLFGSKAGAVKGFHSLLVLPLVPPGSEGEPIGSVVVARRTWPDFEPADTERLQVLLHQVGAAVSNGRLFTEHETRGVTDGMTGLPNHRRFQEVLGQKIAAAERTGLKMSLLLMDIDRFKSVNDTYGHPMGDEVIKRLASMLGGTARDGTDLAARYGGEEFCLLLEGTDAQGALVLADRIRESFSQEVFVMNEGGRPVSFRCTVSIGIANWPADTRDQAALIEMADQALYVSKEGGRDRATCFSHKGKGKGRSSEPGRPSVTSPGQVRAY